MPSPGGSISTGHGHAVRPLEHLSPAALRDCRPSAESTPERQHFCSSLLWGGSLFFSLPCHPEAGALWPASFSRPGDPYRAILERLHAEGLKQSVWFFLPSVRSSCPPCSWRCKRSHLVVLSRQCSQPMSSPNGQPRVAHAIPLMDELIPLFQGGGVVWPRCSRNPVVCHMPIPAHRPRLLCGDGDPAAGRDRPGLSAHGGVSLGSTAGRPHPGALHGDDLVVHEGPLENGVGLTFYTGRQVHVVNGRRGDLHFGSRFPEAQGVFVE